MYKKEQRFVFYNFKAAFVDGYRVVEEIVNVSGRKEWLGNGEGAIL